MGGTGKNLKIKIYPTCFEKVFFLIERITMVYFSIAYPLFSDREAALILVKSI